MEETVSNVSGTTSASYNGAGQVSTCISSYGEYNSSHEPDADYVCKLCAVLDEDALIAELNRLRTRVEQQRAEVLHLADGIAEMIHRSERAAGFIAQSRQWGDRTGQIVGIYQRGAAQLRHILTIAQCQPISTVRRKGVALMRETHSYLTDPLNPWACCVCGHIWMAHDVYEYSGDGSETCCQDGCPQTGCPGKG